MLRRNIKPILAFLTVTFLGALTASWVGPCHAIYMYDWTVQMGLGEVLLKVAIMGGIFLGGIILFQVIKGKLKQREDYSKIKLLYFSILPLFVFHNQFLAIPKHIVNRPVEMRICAKSTADAMTVKSYGLNLEEYNFLKDRFFLLPDLPLSSERISIFYYTDDFLGDFILRISCFCGKNEKIGTADKRWFIKDVPTIGKKSLHYEDGAN